MNEKKDKLLSEAHDTIYKLMLGNHPLNSMNQFVVDDVMGFGTTLEEKIFGIESMINLGEIQREQSEGLNMTTTVNPVFKRISTNEETAIFVDEISICIPMEEDKHELFVRMSTIFEYIGDTWKVTHWHASAPVATEGDTWHTNEWKRKNDELQKLVNEKTAALNNSLEELKATQVQLIHSEKMASLGELTAGIAHEIQNPLNFVNNFSEINQELIQEALEETDKDDASALHTLLADLKENEEKILYHGKRADAIVKSMLLHSRKNTGIKDAIELNEMVDEYLRLSYHGIRAKNKNFNATLETEYDPSVGHVKVIGQEIGRVLLNLFNNSFYSVTKKKANTADDYNPVVCVKTEKKNKEVIITIKDNGLGIKPEVKGKIFQPFFTTKPAGEGTGLGLSLSYDIITKGHSGNMVVNSEEGSFAEFQIIIPIT